MTFEEMGSFNLRKVQFPPLPCGKSNSFQGHSRYSHGLPHSACLEGARKCQLPLFSGIWVTEK